MIPQATRRNVRYLTNTPPGDRLWPSFLDLKKDLLSAHKTALPNSIRDTLLAMNANHKEKKSTAQQQHQSTASTGKYNHNDQQNLHQIGVMTRRINTFLEQQMDKNTSEAVYTAATLDAYDAMVWDFNAPFHWRIHRDDIAALYEQGLQGSERHCEVAVGTGLFLRSWANATGSNERCMQHLTLMDLSTSSLERCHQRLQQVDYFDNNHNNHNVTIERVPANILKSPDTTLQGQFNSVAANFLLHCLHGKSLLDKRSAVESCAALLQKDGVLFGSTILGKDLLQDDIVAGPHAIATNQLYNDLGIFGNIGDTFSDMSTILEDSFQEVAIYKVGYCAVWLARNPKMSN